MAALVAHVEVCDGGKRAIVTEPRSRGNASAPTAFEVQTEKVRRHRMNAARLRFALLGAVVSIASAAAQAQAWPARPIHFVVPFSAGGAPRQPVGAAGRARGHAADRTGGP